MQSDQSNDIERRKQQRLRKLGTNAPRCATCGEDRWQTLELHHIEGQANGATLAIECRNCHRVLSDAQLDHPKPETVDDPELNAFATFLLGFADLLELAVAKLREIARDLMARINGEEPHAQGT